MKGESMAMSLLQYCQQYLHGWLSFLTSPACILIFNCLHSLMGWKVLHLLCLVVSIQNCQNRQPSLPFESSSQSPSLRKLTYPSPAQPIEQFQPCFLYQEVCLASSSMPLDRYTSASHNQPPPNINIYDNLIMYIIKCTLLQ